MFMFRNSCSCSGFQICVVDFKMKWGLSGCAVSLWLSMTSDIASQCSQVTTFVGGLKRCYQSDKPGTKSNAVYSNASNTC